ncbi:hypothetical protein AVEN_110886-1 [Araneus ventricosus]|uniref:Uncharacterized protein n=1 Tax=Araneus ventricosus TaxID=182803 RepID=A0A4Y2PRE7_ARAVE|nr:hypothetical protein AVEN_110886-1 [Araneus ventricosus]
MATVKRSLGGHLISLVPAGHYATERRRDFFILSPPYHGSLYLKLVLTLFAKFNLRQSKNRNQDYPESYVKVPTIYETDSGLDSLEDEKQDISKKTEYSDLIPGYTPMNDFENNLTYTDFERPPSYEEVVCSTTEDNLDVSHPYRFEVDIKLERFPQYPILPTCPTLDDMSEKRFDSTGSSHSGGNSEKDGKTYSDRKKTPT